MSGPKIVIIVGPNGAGKTTFARAFLPQEAQCPRFINADLIAAGLSVRRRFIAGRSNFERYYRAAVDSWAVYDNSGDEPVLIEWGQST